MKTILLGFLIISIQSNAQNVEDCFKETKVNNSKNSIKINIADIIHGHPGIYYSQVFTENLTIDFGLYKIVTYYIPQFTEIIDSKKYIEENIIGGYGYSLSPRLYYSTTSFKTTYLALLYKDRYYNLENKKKTLREINFVGGYQFDISKKFLLDFSLGIGPLWIIEKVNTIKNTELTANSSINLKIGYKF